MGIDEVGEKALKEKEGLAEKGKKKLKLKEELEKNKELAKGFEEENNYSSAYFMYFQAAKTLGKIYVDSIMGGDSDLSKMDSLRFAAEKEKFGIDKENFQYLLKRFDSFLMRGEIEGEDVERLEEFLQRLEEGVKNKGVIS